MRPYWFLCILTAALAGCASVSGGSGGGQSGEQAYLESVQRGEEPGEVAYLMEERDQFRVGVASGDLNSEESEYRNMLRVDEAARDTLAAKIGPWLVAHLDKYSKWFTWSERRPNSEYVTRLSQELARGSIKVWDRMYHQIKQYQSVHVLHRMEIEITIIGEAIARDHKRGGSDIPSLLNRMDQLQSSYAIISGQLEMMKTR